MVLDLLERDHELTELEFAIAEARQGSGRHVLITGTGGVGKTALLDEGARRAKDAGFEVLRAGASELEGGFAFGLVRRLFEPALSDASTERRRRLMSGAAAPARPLVDPDLSEPDLEQATYARLQGLHRLCANLAEDTPLALVVDELQFADAPSFACVAFLSRRISDHAMLLLTASGPPTSEAAGRGSLLELSREPGTCALKPSPLSAQAIAALIELRLEARPQHEFAQACHRASGGNPLLAVELLREARAREISPTDINAPRVPELRPVAIRELVEHRLTGLDRAARELARTAAIFGGPMPIEDGAAVAGLELTTAYAAATRLARAGMLEDSDQLEYVHEMMCAAVYDSIPLADRRARHGRAAEILRDRGCGVAVVAAQLLRTKIAGGWAIDVLRAAAGEALESGDRELAVLMLRRAFAEDVSDADRPELLLELGRAEAHSGAPDAAHTLEAAAREAGSAAGSARATVELARVLQFGGRSLEAVEALDAALVKLNGDDPKLESALRAELVGASLFTARAQPTIATAHEPHPEVERTSAELAADAYRAASDGAGHDRVAALASRALASGPLRCDPLAGGHAFVGVALSLTIAERYAEADALLTRALGEAASGSVTALAAAAALRSQVMARRGRLDDAERDARAALACACGTAHAFAPIALASIAQVAIDRGAVDRELELLADRVLSGADRNAIHYGHAAYARALIRLDRGDAGGGVAELIRAGDRERARGARNPAILPWRSAVAPGLLQLGAAERALRLAGEEVELARAFGAPRCLGVALVGQASITPPEDRARLLAEAVEVLAGADAELELARALIALGTAQRCAGRRVASRDDLRRGREIAVNLGAHALAERAHAELLAAGARPRRAALSGYDSLTPSERRVTRLAVTGQSNREIAQTLFVSERTVETHLHNAYGKLSINSRRDLQSVIPSD